MSRRCWSTAPPARAATGSSPIDECYALVGLIRGGWQGLSGGAQVWEDLERFFADLERRARTASAQGQTAQANAATAMGAGGREG